MILNSYRLLDFGNGQKLEQFGDKILVRPSSLAATERRFPAKWKDADAVFDDKAGWAIKGPKFEEWQIKEEDFSLLLRLQQNGQVGIFPEHAHYLSDVLTAIQYCNSTSTPTQLLNLFAYTGMCSVVAAKAGADVCHVDSSKASLDWAKQNFDLNKLNGIRLIKEDALTFMRKEAKRQKIYQVIVIDPPGFSRFKEGSWNLEEIIGEILTLCKTLLEPKLGALYFTFHGSELNGEIIRNWILDIMGFPPNKVVLESLCLEETTSGRRIPASTLIKAVNHAG